MRPREFGDGDGGDPPPKPSWTSRALWFVALWAGGVAAVAVVGTLIKLALKP
ncbi:MAG: DUF2474 family protein [Hyphomicrobiaceae bacterium]